MVYGEDRVEALDWVLAKLSAASKPGVGPVVFKPPAFKSQLKPLTPPPPPTLQAPAAGVSLADKQKELDLTREKEFGLWKAWKAEPPGPKKGDLFQQLAKSQAKIINRHLSRFPGVEVSKTAMKADLYKHYKVQLEKFDPSRGVKLSTWVQWGLKGVKRFVVKHQNIVRFTEPVADRIMPYRVATSELKERLGYDPTLQQIVEHTHSPQWGGKKLSMKEVLQIKKQVRKGFDISGGGDEVEGAGLHANDPMLHAAHTIYHDIKPHEQKVHELMFPRDGAAPIYKSGVLAKKLGWEVSKVSKAKNAILSKVKNRLGE